jgi:hypothetical protein
MAGNDRGRQDDDEEGGARPMNVRHRVSKTFKSGVKEMGVVLDMVVGTESPEIQDLKLIELDVGDAMNARRIRSDIKYLTFLFQPYELEYWWFSSVDLLRRLMLTSLLLFFENPKWQLIYTLGVCLFFVNVYRECQPYAHKMHNTAAHVWQGQILMCVICVILIDTGLVKATLDSDNYLGWFLILFNLMTLFVISLASRADTEEKDGHRAARLKRSKTGYVKEKINRMTSSKLNEIGRISNMTAAEMSDFKEGYHQSGL